MEAYSGPLPAVPQAAAALAGPRGDSKGRVGPVYRRRNVLRKLMKRVAILGVALSITLALVFPVFAADVDYHLARDAEVFTLVNLHPDEQRHRLYSTNYQQPGLIPFCTKVKIESVNKREMVFRVLDTGRKYDYIFHNTMRHPIPTHLDKFFGKACDPKKVETMSEIDRQGISQGRVLPGMTRDGVILAIGYPPEHATPNLESNTWKYWRTRFATQLVYFADGKAVDIKE